MNCLDQKSSQLQIPYGKIHKTRDMAFHPDCAVHTYVLQLVPAEVSSPSNFINHLKYNEAKTPYVMFSLLKNQYLF